MQAVLYVAHGSRVKAGVEEAIQFIQRAQVDVDVPIQEISFLELAEPSILQGIENCIAKGATSIAVAPILLLTAQHANEDIPLELEKVKSIYPQLSLTYGRPFGVHDKLVSSIYDRVIKQKKCFQRHPEVLLIGRGSSDPAVLHDLNEIAAKLKKDYGFAQVNTCFLYGKGRLLDKALEDIRIRDVTELFIVPYLLFTGLLRQGIEKKIEQLAFDSGRVMLCESLGYDENVRQVLLERVDEILPWSNELMQERVK